MLVLVMKWWAFALAAQAVSNIAVFSFSNASDEVCKVYIRTTGLFAAMGANVVPPRSAPRVSRPIFVPVYDFFHTREKPEGGETIL